MTCQHGVGISRFLGLQPTCMFIVVVICCVFFFLWVIMPLLPLCYRLLNKLDDVNHSFKCAHLSKYLQDISIKPFIPPTSNSDSHDSDLSLLSSLSSLSSISSFNLDNKSSFQPTPLLLLLDIEELYFLMTQPGSTCYTKKSSPQGSFARTLPSWRHHRFTSSNTGTTAISISIEDKYTSTPTFSTASSTRFAATKFSTTTPMSPRLWSRFNSAIFLFWASHYGEHCQPRSNWALGWC